MKLQHSILSISLGLFMSSIGLHAEEPATPAAPEASKAPTTPEVTTATELDFGDFSSSAITTKAWEAYTAKNYTNAKAYANKCIEMFKEQAVTMQKGLSTPATEKEEVFKSWALNDVGTCYFIIGQSLEGENKGKEAIDYYKFLVENLSYAQCWDANGWFWKPADAARERVKALEFDALQ